MSSETAPRLRGLSVNSEDINRALEVASAPDVLETVASDVFSWCLQWLLLCTDSRPFWKSGVGGALEMILNHCE